MNKKKNIGLFIGLADGHIVISAVCGERAGE